MIAQKLFVSRVHLSTFSSNPNPQNKNRSLFLFHVIYSRSAIVSNIVLLHFTQNITALNLFVNMSAVMNGRTKGLT